MDIGILGTGGVGRTLAAALIAAGHTVMLGTRDVAVTRASTAAGPYGGPSFAAWHAGQPAVKLGSFAETAAFGALIINAANGATALDTLAMAALESQAGKTMIDVSNDLDASQGMPPRLRVADVPGASLGERIQAAYPMIRVVKSLNTMNAQIMLNPAALSGASSVFVSGDDAAAKQAVRAFLESFGWRDIIDLGDITTARSTEMLLPVWLKLWGTLGSGNFNFGIVR